ncbi:hypothetical protein IV498_13795 [Paenarthrobacter sp. Z7-10]|uniref:hypothetical protein n=1 Tax=Paenarthrobacter sp. Z7-10 TaxID=2787635 RepID=UPI0022A980E9|nr:hypothetical protein [Paenarthrobacter sp. Z7-10]MCZ2404222.1 hypothetical protein [Paenarthrobacter sp. Z7-10]
MVAGNVTAISRNPDQLDLFAVHDDGRVWTMWWNPATGWSDWRSLGGFFPVGARITATSRSSGNLDLFITGNDGRVYTSWWYEGGDWSGINDNWRSLGGFFPAGAPVAAVARSSNNLDLFITGNDGRVYTSWWYAGADWSGVNDNWRSLGGIFPAGAPVAVTSRSAGNLDLFITGNDGRVYTSWWYDGADWSGVNDNWRSLGGFFPAGAPVAGVARSSNNLDLFITGNDGRVYTSWWYAGADWSGVNDNWRSLGGFFPPGAPVAVTSRSAGNLDLFITGNDGRVYTSWWYDGADWSGVNDNWRSLGGFFPAGAPLAATARSARNLDLFITGNDAQIYTSWWYEGVDWSGVNDNWALLDKSHQRIFSAQIASGGLAALGGWGEVTVFDDGTTRWRGHAHDSGADGYDFGVSALLGDRNGHAIALAHSGHVGGTFTAGSRNHDWDDRYPGQPILSAHYADFAGGDFHFSTDYSSDIGSTLESAVSFVTRWLVGSTPLGQAIGLVIFVGVEVGSLISTGSLVPGARVVEGVLWLAGPSNTLLALAAEGIASAGSRTRELSEEEYNWADAQVFAGTLPPRDRIVLTDTIGGGNRAFTFPRFDSKITVNMGPEAFDDPRQYHVGDGSKSYGEVFIHELTHAWQIAHTPMELSLLADALASKICEAGGGNPYSYGPAGQPYADFNLEQQAQIVSDWYSGRNNPAAMDPGSTYFRYVAANIRTGQY